VHNFEISGNQRRHTDVGEQYAVAATQIDLGVAGLITTPRQ